MEVHSALLCHLHIKLLFANQLSRNYNEKNSKDGAQSLQTVKEKDVESRKLAQIDGISCGISTKQKTAE